MKLPFSYKHDLFNYIFLISLSTHVSLLGINRLFNPQLIYAVKPGPSSLEVFIVKELVVPKPPQEIPKDRITFKEKQEKNEKMVKKRKSMNKLLKSQIKTINNQGAITRVKPLTFQNPAPRYPQEARRNGWEGLVKLRVLVEKDGWPTKVMIEKSSGFSILDQSALETVKRWHFVAAKSGRLNFSSWVNIPIRFKLVNNDRN